MMNDIPAGTVFTHCPVDGNPCEGQGMIAECDACLRMFLPDVGETGRTQERRENHLCDPRHKCEFCGGTGYVLGDRK